MYIYTYTHTHKQYLLFLRKLFIFLLYCCIFCHLASYSQSWRRRTSMQWRLLVAPPGFPPWRSESASSLAKSWARRWTPTRPWPEAVHCRWSTLTLRSLSRRSGPLALLRLIEPCSNALFLSPVCYLITSIQSPRVLHHGRGTLLRLPQVELCCRGRTEVRSLDPLSGKGNWFLMAL